MVGFYVGLGVLCVAAMVLNGFGLGGVALAMAVFGLLATVAHAGRRD